MINRFDSLDISPKEGNFFLPHHFYLSLKKTITTEDYNSIKTLYQMMKLKTLGELNKLYNFQDNIILRKIFENRSHQLQKLFKYNPKK